MKAIDIEIGGTYMAKVSGIVVPVKVLRAEERSAFGGKWRTIWVCRNERTGRTIEVKSAQRFRRVAVSKPQTLAYAAVVPADGRSYDD